MEAQGSSRDSADAYLRVFAWCHQQKLFADGIQVARRMAEAMSFNEAGATWEIGRFQEESGDTQAALEFFERALLLAGPDEEKFRPLLLAAIARVPDQL